MGRKRRISTYQQAPLKRTKNIHTRRTRASVVHRGISKLSESGSDKRMKKK